MIKGCRLQTGSLCHFKLRLNSSVNAKVKAGKHKDKCKE